MQQSDTIGRMGNEGNKALVERFLSALWNERDVGAAMALRDSACISRGLDATPLDNAAYRTLLERMQKRLVKTHVVVDDLIEEGPKVAFRATVTGEMDGKPVRLGGFGVVTFAEGKIVAAENAWDGLGLAAQLGNGPPALASMFDE
jgi:ketosteroid isomerase-like protein